MPLQWLKKKKEKVFESRKENSKMNNRLQKLIADIKSKRDTFTTVQTGFPSSVASFVTNTWMPSHDGVGDDQPVKKKKKRWPYRKKTETCKSDLNKVENPPLDEVRHSSLPSESVEQLGANPQSVDEISQHFDNFSHSGGQFRNDPQPESQSVGSLGNELKPMSEFGNEVQFLGEVDNPVEIVRHVREQNPHDQIVKDDSCLGQLEDACDPFCQGQARVCPMCRELLAILVLLAVYISVVLDAKMAAVGFTVIVYFLLRVFKHEFLSRRTTILSIFSCVWEVFRGLCSATIGKIIRFLKCKKGPRSEGGLPSKEASNCFVLSPILEIIQGVLLKTDANNQLKRRKALVQNSGIHMSVSKGRKLSHALASGLWIVVLLGLIAGRFTAFMLALAWCLLVKSVQIAEQRQQTILFDKGKM